MDVHPRVFLLSLRRLLEHLCANVCARVSAALTSLAGSGGEGGAALAAAGGGGDVGLVLAASGLEGGRERHPAPPSNRAALEVLTGPLDRDRGQAGW